MWVRNKAAEATRAKRAKNAFLAGLTADENAATGAGNGAAHLQTHKDLTARVWAALTVKCPSTLAPQSLNSKRPSPVKQVRTASCGPGAAGRPTSANSRSAFAEEREETPGEQVCVGGPAGGQVAAVFDDEAGTVIGHRSPGPVQGARGGTVTGCRAPP